MPSVRTTSLRSRCDHLRDDLAGLSPAYFGMAMATGIVSLSAHMQAWTWLASALFWLNASLYAGLWCLLLTRIAWHPGAVRADLLDHLRAPGFFTTVVATGVVGTQCLLIADSLRWAIALWCVALVLWLLLTYTIFTMLVVKEDKPPLDRGINGGWLLAVVATQAVAVLGTLIATRIPQPYRLELNFFALSMWLWGGMLYIWMMSLIFYRYTFFRFSPADLSPPYWINMGAMAISTLAGSQLILNAPHAPFLESLLPFIKGFTVDPDADRARRVAPRRDALPAALRPAVLGCGVPDRDVLGLHPAPARGDGPALPRPHSARIPGHRAVRLGTGLRRPGDGPARPRARTTMRIAGLMRDDQNAGTTAPWYLSARNCFTSGEFSAAASFLIAGLSALSTRATSRLA